MGATHPSPWIRHCYISEMVEDRWVHAARRLTSIEFSFDPCNIYCDGPRGVGYPADARSVGDSHPSCLAYLACYSRAVWALALAFFLALAVVHSGSSFNSARVQCIGRHCTMNL